MATRTKKAKKKTQLNQTTEHYVIPGSVHLDVYVRLVEGKHGQRPIDAYVDGTQFEPDIPGVEWNTDDNRSRNRLYASDPVATREWLRRNAALLLDGSD